MGANCFGQQAKKEKQRLEKKRKQMQEKKRIQDQQLKRMFFQYLLAKQREAQQRNQIPQFPSGLVQQIQIQQQVISSCDSQDAKNLSDSKSKKYSSKLQIINKNSKIKFNQHNNDVKKSKLGHDNDGNNEKNQQVNQEQNDNSNINKDEQKNKQNIKKDQKVNNDQNNKGMLSKFLNSVIDYFKQSPDKQIQKKAFMTKVIVKNHQKECTKQTEIIYSKIDNEIKWLNDPSDSSFKIKQYQIKEVDFQTLPLSERQKIQQIYKKMIKKENNKNQDKKGNKQKSFQKSVY